MKVLTVNELHRFFKHTVETKFRFFEVRGFITSKITQSSYSYFFTLSNEQKSALTPKSVELTCMLPKYRLAKLSQEDINLEELQNHQIIVSGRALVLSSNAEPKIDVFKITLHPTPEEQAKEFEDLRQELAQSGVLNANAKLPAPTFVTHVGLITSEESDAYYDVITNIQERSKAKISFYHTAVQGSEAPLGLIAALEYFNNLPPKDKPQAIILARGGGEATDLSVFNHKEVVLAVAKCTIPVYTGIGHTRNVSLTDLAAKCNCHTPTKAALTLFPTTWEKTLATLQGLRASLEALIKTKLQNLAVELPALESQLISPQAKINAAQEATRVYASAITSPANNLAKLKQQCQSLTDELERTCKTYLENKRLSLNHNGLQIESLNVKTTLQKGYAMVKDQHGTLVKRAKGLKRPFTIIFAEDTFKVE